MLSNFLFSKPKNVGNAKCRPTIDRVSTNYWPIHRSSIDQLSAKCRRNVGEMSEKCRRKVSEVSVNEKLYWSAETHLERLSTVSRLSVDPLSTTISTDCRPRIDRLSTEYRPTVDRVSTDYQSSGDRLSTECQPLYRPLYQLISQSTLLTVNKIWITCNHSVALTYTAYPNGLTCGKWNLTNQSVHSILHISKTTLRINIW